MTGETKILIYRVNPCSGWKTAGTKAHMTYIYEIYPKERVLLHLCKAEIKGKHLNDIGLKTTNGQYRERFYWSLHILLTS